MTSLTFPHNNPPLVVYCLLFYTVSEKAVRDFTKITTVSISCLRKIKGEKLKQEDAEEEHSGTYRGCRAARRNGNRSRSLRGSASGRRAPVARSSKI